MCWQLSIISPSGGSIGIGFAIPSTLAKNIIDQLKNSGHIRRGWLGVHIQNVSQDIADAIGLGQAHGALIAGVTTDGPAAKAGIQAGDVIVTFDGKDVPDMHRLPLMVAETDVDKTVDVGIFRKGQSLTLKVKVGELKAKESAEQDNDQVEPAQPATPTAQKVDDLGLSVAPLTDTLRTRYGIKKTVTGMVVTAIIPDGLAADQNLQPGDVIAEAAQTEVKTAQDLIDRAKTAKKNSKPLLLLINRKDELQYVAIAFGKKK